MPRRACHSTTTGNWRRDRGVRPYALALVAVGLPISLYHVGLERVPSLGAPAIR